MTVSLYKNKIIQISNCMVMGECVAEKFQHYFFHRACPFNEQGRDYGNQCVLLHGMTENSDGPTLNFPYCPLISGIEVRESELRKSVEEESKRRTYNSKGTSND